MTLRFKAKVWIHRKVSLAIQAPERSHEEFGHRGDDFGSIAPGKVADVIAMKIDPITHIDQLGEPGKVSFVMKEGKVYKDER
jgi:hypothetical protein